MFKCVTYEHCCEISNLIHEEVWGGRCGGGGGGGVAVRGWITASRVQKEPIVALKAFACHLKRARTYGTNISEQKQEKTKGVHLSCCCRFRMCMRSVTVL